MSNMNKFDLIAPLSKETDLSAQKAEEVVDTFFDTMSNALIAGDRIAVRGFAPFTYASTMDIRAGTQRQVQKRWWRRRGYRFSRWARTFEKG